jgi:hypothetical protein
MTVEVGGRAACEEGGLLHEKWFLLSNFFFQLAFLKGAVSPDF